MQKLCKGMRLMYKVINHLYISSLLSTAFSVTTVLHVQVCTAYLLTWLLLTCYLINYHMLAAMSILHVVGIFIGASLSEPNTHETASPAIYISMYLYIYICRK